jgi:NADP-dependent 3-hydroxy acid dehydrogenase YdfG
VEVDLFLEGIVQSHTRESRTDEIDPKYAHLTRPLEWIDEDLPKFNAVLSGISSSMGKDLFPHLCGVLNPARVSALSRLSYIVGMVCPGLYSLFASMDITLNRSRDPLGWISVKSDLFDQRFNLLTLALDGELFGTLKAYRRPKPFEQLSIREVKEFVLADEFENCNALIVGGSRGLGEMTAKILCAGGGKVHLGYANGKEEAEKVATEIKASGLGFCDPVKFDIFDMDPNQQKDLFKAIDSIYYFPTPPIFKKQARLFHARYFNEFVEFYVKRFFDLCEAVEAEAPKRVVIYFPSSTAIDIRPRGMTVYSMAKAAAEILIQDMNRSYKKVEVVVSRLPRLGSDQTNAFLGSPPNENCTVLLPVIRNIRDKILV